MWVPDRPEFGAWGELPVAKVRSRFARELVEVVAADPRIHASSMTEYTLQPVIFEHASWLLGARWQITVEDFVPHTNLKADLVVQKLTREGTPHGLTGVIAIEVKPCGGVEKLRGDVDKLKKYITKARNDVNCGLLYYLSSRQTDPSALRRQIGTFDSRIHAVWIPKRRIP